MAATAHFLALLIISRLPRCQYLPQWHQTLPQDLSVQRRSAPQQRRYSVKKGEHALFTADLWKYTSKPSKATIQAAEEAGQDAPKESPHYYKKLSYLFGMNQVERIKSKPAKK